MELPKIIIEDTLQKVGYHDNVAAYCADAGIRLIRSRLVCGDYATIYVPEHIEDVDAWLTSLVPNLQFKSTGVCIDTKDGLGEVYKNLVLDHDRVARECDRAVENGWKLIFLVEDEDIESVDEVHNWVNPRYQMWATRYEKIKEGHKKGRYMGTKLPKPPVSSERLETMMKTFAEHHECEWCFCSHKDTGRVIAELLSYIVLDKNKAFAFSIDRLTTEELAELIERTQGWVKNDDA